MSGLCEGSFCSAVVRAFVDILKFRSYRRFFLDRVEEESARRKYFFVVIRFCAGRGEWTQHCGRCTQRCCRGEAQAMPAVAAYSSLLRDTCDLYAVNLYLVIRWTASSNSLFVTERLQLTLKHTQLPARANDTASPLHFPFTGVDNKHVRFERGRFALEPEEEKDNRLLRFERGKFAFGSPGG